MAMGQFAGKRGLADTRFADEKGNFTGGENEFYAFIGICKVHNRYSYFKVNFSSTAMRRAFWLP